MDKILCYEKKKVYYLCMKDGVHQVKVLGGKAWLHFDGYCFREPKLDNVDIELKVAGRDDTVVTRCALWSSYEDAAKHPMQLPRYDFGDKDHKVDMESLWNEIMARNTWFSAPKTLDTTNGVRNYNPTVWYWNGIKAVSESILEPYTINGNMGLRVNLDTLEVISNACIVINHPGNLYPTKDACEAVNKCALFTFDDTEDDEDFAEKKREEFREYVVHHCPGFEDKIDWTYFENLESMPANLAIQVEVWVNY